MKKCKQTVILAYALFAIALISCNKDKTIEKKNQILYNGSEFELSKGYLEFVGLGNSNPTCYIYKMLIVSSGVLFDSNTYEISGTGHELEFEIFSSSSTGLVEGTYTFTSSLDCIPNVFDYAWVYLDFDFNPIKSATLDYVTEGTVKVNKTGSAYEITIDCKLSDGKILTAYYNGDLEFIY